MKPITPLILFSALIISGCGGAQQNTGPLPVIDLTAQYPQKDIVLQDIADIEYLSLNGKDAPLIGQVSIAYISNECYILYDRQHGEVFVLEKDGTVRCHFNQTGNGPKEYTRIGHLTYDPQKREIYIVDTYGSNAILVYTETGTFIQNFQEYARQYVSELYNFDSQTLLAYIRPFRPDPNILNHTTPYLFLSKQTGEIESRLSLCFPERLSSTMGFTLPDGQYAGIAISVSADSRKYGDHFLIADLSADTLYILSKERSLTPVLARTPSVYAQDPFVAWSVGLMTEKFISIATVKYDFEAMRTAALNNQPMPQISGEEYLFYFQNHEFISPNFINADWPARNPGIGMYKVSMDEKNMSAEIIQAERLVEALEKGELSGKLKEVAQTLTYDDNPVLMLLRYK